MNYDFLAITGSRLYGTNTDSSDHDYRGWILPSKRELLSLTNSFEQNVSTVSDTVVYSLRKWLQHLINGNTNILECVYSNNIVGPQWAIDFNESIKPYIISKKFIRSILGFACSEKRRVRGTQLKLIENTNGQKDAIEKLCSVFQLTRLDRDFIIDFIERGYNCKITEEVKHTKIGDKRKQLIDSYGYDTKSASNVIRLYAQAIHLMDYGYLSFPIKNHKELLAYKLGQYSLEEFEKHAEELDTIVKNNLTNCVLREHADVSMLDSLYLRLVMNLEDLNAGR